MNTTILFKNTGPERVHGLEISWQRLGITPNQDNIINIEVIAPKSAWTSGGRICFPASELEAVIEALESYRKVKVKVKS
jgi:hypothetical protein